MICVSQKPNFVVAIKCITKKNLAKSQELLKEEIKILKVYFHLAYHMSNFNEISKKKYKGIIYKSVRYISSYYYMSCV